LEAQADPEYPRDHRACFRSGMNAISQSPGTPTAWASGVQDVSAVVSADESKGVR
jgi:hypothetical protein